jgi:small nuclear ribonucleoprotein (snRNP)-like protein
MEPEEDSPSVAKLRSLLNRSTRIEITDGRLFVGQFMCIDHSKNIILAGAYESRPNQPQTVDQHAVQPTPTLGAPGEDEASKRRPGILKKPPPEEGMSSPDAGSLDMPNIVS